MEMSPLVHDFTLAIAELPPMQTVPCRALLLFLSGLHSPIRTFSGQLALECIQYLRDMIVELGSRNSGHGRKGRVAFRGAAPRFQDGPTSRTQVRSQSSQLLFCLLHSLPLAGRSAAPYSDERQASHSVWNVSSWSTDERYAPLVTRSQGTRVRHRYTLGSVIVATCAAFSVPVADQWCPRARRCATSAIDYQCSSVKCY